MIIDSNRADVTKISHCALVKSTSSVFKKAHRARFFNVRQYGILTVKV